MDYKKLRGKRAGPGGYKCPCCGPSPRHRKAYKRAAKRRERQLIAREIREAPHVEV
jgi:hypothetical protein